MRFQGTNKRPAEGEELNDFVTKAVKEIIKSNNLVIAKAKTTPDQKKSSKNSTLKTSILGKNNITPAGSGGMKRECQKKSQRQNRDYIR